MELYHKDNIMIDLNNKTNLVILLLCIWHKEELFHQSNGITIQKFKINGNKLLKKF